MSTPGDIHERIDILSLAGLLNKHGFEWLEFFDQQFGGLRRDRSVKVDTDIHFITACLAKCSEGLSSMLDKFRVFDDVGWVFLGDTGLNYGVTFLLAFFHVL